MEMSDINIRGLVGDAGFKIQSLQLTPINAWAASRLTKYCQSPHPILPVPWPNIVSRLTKYCQSHRQILPVASANNASRLTKYCKSPHQILPVVSPNIASRPTKYCQSPQQILPVASPIVPVASPNIVSRLTKYCQLPHQIVPVAPPNIASRLTEYCRSPHQIVPVASPNIASRLTKYCQLPHQICVFGEATWHTKYTQIATTRRAGIILKTENRLWRHYCLPPEHVCIDKWGILSVQATQNPQIRRTSASGHKATCMYCSILNSSLEYNPNIQYSFLGQGIPVVYAFRTLHCDVPTL